MAGGEKEKSRSNFLDMKRREKDIKKNEKKDIVLTEKGRKLELMKKINIATICSVDILHFVSCSPGPYLSTTSYRF